MDAVTDPRVETVVVMSASQCGKTETVNNVVGYHVDQEPCPMLLIQPTLEMGQAWSKDRFAPMLRDTPALRGKVRDARSRDSANTIMHKVFPGGHITIAGSNSAASLAMRPVRIVLCDEVDRYPASAGTEGDPVNLAFKRATTFWNRKRVVTSTPTIKGASRIERFWEGSDKRRYHVPCPHCGEFQALWWKNLKWERDEAERLKFVVYVCEHCSRQITDADKPLMLRRGEWRASAPFTGTAGFHLNELYSPWVSFEQMAAGFLDAKRDPQTLQVWINTSLGETWEEGAEGGVDTGTLFARREEYPHVSEGGRQVIAAPEKVLVLTAGVDVQDDRLEVEVVGWGIGEESWNVDYLTLFGDPAKGKVWEELDDALKSTYPHESGIRLRISAACIDTGGHHTQQVYSFVKPRQNARIFAIKGANTPGRPVVGRPSVNNSQRVKLFPIGVDTAKEVVFTRLKIDEPGYGYCHFPLERDEEYFAQLTAERPVTRFYKGVQSRSWVKGRTRNEALDCRVYALGALYILNPNFPMIAERLEEQAARVEQPAAQPQKQPDRPARRTGGFVRNW